MEVDPLASMRCWAMDVQVGGRTFEVPALPAVDWWPILISGNPIQVVDIFTSTDADLDELILTGEISAEDLSSAAVDIIEEVAGRSLHASYVLVTVASNNWPAIGGELAQRGFCWDVQPIGAALDAIYSIVLNGLPEKTEDGKRNPREEFLKLLENESMTTGKRTGRAREKALSEFEAMAGPKPTTGVRSTGAPSGSARPRTRQQRRPPRQDDP